MFTNYSPQSSWKTTSQTSWYLDILNLRDIPALNSDQKIKLTPQHQYRPDILSYQLYGTTRLWWVFSVRNKNIIKDPIWDFKKDLEIFVTDRDTLFGILNA